jgi:GNAT superfamily N-acetyltransferase
LLRLAADRRHDVIRVRPATTDDLDDLARVNIAAWRSAYAGIVPRAYLEAMDPEDYRQRWGVRISGESGGPGEYLVGVLDGALVSYVCFGPYRTQEDAPSPEDTADWGEIYAIYTDPEVQGRGVGSAVHDAALARMAALGHREAALWVLRGNVRTRRWYAERGWRADGSISMWSAGSESLPEVRLRHPLD